MFSICVYVCAKNAETSNILYMHTDSATHQPTVHIQYTRMKYSTEAVVS